MFKNFDIDVLDVRQEPNGSATTIAVGKKWPGPIPPAGVRLEFSPRGNPKLFAVYESPTPLEVHGFRKNPIQIALVPGGKHTLFFMFEIERGTNGWADCPYSFLKLAPENREFTRAPESADGYFMVVHLVDQNGIVHAIRGVSMTPKFSDALDENLRHQARHSGSYSAAAHDAEIGLAYKRWATSAHMVRAAVIKETAGEASEKV